jgi:hypothetical protein
MKTQALLITALLLASPLYAKRGGKSDGGSTGVVAGTYSGMYYDSLLTFTVHANGQVTGDLEVIDNRPYPGSWGNSSEYFEYGTIDGTVGGKGRVHLNLAWHYDYPPDTGLPNDYYESIELRASTDANGPALMINLGYGEKIYFPLS